MPIHDWTKVDAGDFHDFHQTWTPEIKRVISERLPDGFEAYIMQKTIEEIPRRREPDVLAVDERFSNNEVSGGTLVLEQPQTRIVNVAESDSEYYARKANRIAIRHRRGVTVAVVEVVSPGNKHSKKAIRQFIAKVEDYIRAGVHILVVDLFPPTRRDPHGLHALLWSRFTDEDVRMPKDKLLTLASYSSGSAFKAFVEPVSVGDRFPLMPLFMTPDKHVKVDLERSYLAAWDNTSRSVRADLERLPAAP